MKRIATGALAGIGAMLAAPTGANVVVPSAATPPPSAGAAKLPVALLVDLNSGRELHGHAQDRRFAPASMTKVMTVFVALEEMSAGRLAATRKLVVADATARRWNGKGTSLYLEGGQAVDVDTLLRGIATVSANDAAVVLAEGYAGDVARWCALMNAQARRLGMTDSRFATPNGWPDGGRTYVSARDLVTLGEALVTRHPAGYHRYFGQTRMRFDGIEQHSHDPTIGVVRGADGIKTGHTAASGYSFLGSAERHGQRLIVVVGGAQSEAARAAAARDLLEWGFSAWQARPLFARGATIAVARVQNGAARSLALVTDRALASIRPNAATGRPRVTVTYRGPLVAPIAKGAQVAQVEIRFEDGGAHRFPLYAGAAVAPAGPLDRLANGIAGLVS